MMQFYITINKFKSNMIVVSVLRNNRYGYKVIFKRSRSIKKWMCDINNRPEEIRNWLEELRLRNWAINNGKNNRLNQLYCLLTSWFTKK